MTRKLENANRIATVGLSISARRVRGDIDLSHLQYVADPSSNSKGSAPDGSPIVVIDVRPGKDNSRQ
ncbi:MAG TPA: hypothetical protein VLB73_00605 [Patescibacteria group bacterium]|nr:hypothetical protein [Patescibacteria group bacterium]